MNKASNNNPWNKVYENFSGNGSVWKNLDPRYEGASPYIVDKIIKIPKNLKILDAGCGDGRNSIYLTKLGYDISGVDLSDSAIGRAKREMKRRKIHVDFKVGSLYKLPFGDSSFDVTFYDLVNIHIEDPDTVLQEFFRTLKKGGLLLFETTSKKDPFSKGRNEFYEGGYYFKFYDLKEAKNLVSKYFRLIKTERNTILNYDHGKSYVRKTEHFHKSFLITAKKS
jgi:ubiquinone/menaquinone biosynthesis C-methylase UbiE